MSKCKDCNAPMIPGITPASPGWCSAECDLKPNVDEGWDDGETTVDTTLEATNVYPAYPTPNSVATSSAFEWFCVGYPTAWQEWKVIDGEPDRDYMFTSKDEAIAYAKANGKIEVWQMKVYMRSYLVSKSKDVTMRARPVKRVWP